MEGMADEHPRQGGWYDESRLGRLAQLGERRVRNAEVVGSSPISSTIPFS